MSIDQRLAELGITLPQAAAPVASYVPAVEIGGDTIARFYSLHMLLIPGLIFALIGLHLYLVIRLGVSSPPWSHEAAGAERPEEEPRGPGLVRPSARGRIAR